MILDPKSFTEQGLHQLTQQNLSLFTDIYRVMTIARRIDALEEQYIARGEAFFHVSGAGHEAVSTLNPHLILEDYLHCHYRDKALMLARGISPEMFFYSLFCKDASHSRGRQMSAHMSDRNSNIVSLVGPVGNNALQAVGIASEIKAHVTNPLVICALGDGTTQQGEVLEAIAEAVRSSLPVLFLIEDNRFSISTFTEKKTFYDLPDQTPEVFYGLPIHRVQGYNPIACYQCFGEVIANIRETRKPALVLMKLERLDNHTNADDQNIYRDAAEIERVRLEADPIKILRNYLQQAGVSDVELTQIDENAQELVKQAAKRAQFSPNPQPIFHAKRPLSNKLYSELSECKSGKNNDRLTMREAICQVFRTRMEADPRIILYGEDIEDPKGDVFGLTKGLSTDFPKRVLNSPLSESTIVGTCIGRALAGGRPVAFLQFADFLPLAFNQIISELGSIYWRTDGNWECPVIIMITCGGYRPGLGPFHAQSLEAIAVHTPGVDVAMPSNAEDAAGMLNAAFDSERPTLFFYPKNCLNLIDSRSTTSSDVSEHYVSQGKGRIDRAGNNITFVAYGNAIRLCRQTSDALTSVGIESEIIDLRWLSPWDEKIVLDSVYKTGKLVVIHEDNQSCAMGSEVMATVAEKSDVSIAMRRVTRADTFVPCNFSNQLEVLPSYKRLLETASELLNLDLEWIVSKKQEAEIFIVEALGGPSDDVLRIIEIEVELGEKIQEGKCLILLETSKALVDIDCPISGIVEKIFVTKGQEVTVGHPLLQLRIAPEDILAEKPITQENPGSPLLKRKTLEKLIETEINQYESIQPHSKVGIKGVASVLPSNIVSNQEVLQQLPEHNAASVFQLTGIESRHWINREENVLTLAVDVANKILKDVKLNISDIDLIICSTGTPLEITPSLACQVLYALANKNHECQAYDINAACSGYLYGLQNSYNYLQTHPNAKVLLITSETLSPLLNPEDFNTHIIFADAATATLLVGQTNIKDCSLLLEQPILSACGEPRESLSVPLRSSGEYISMDGNRVFKEGVKQMSAILQRVCNESHLNLNELNLIISHQANQRIIKSIGQRLNITDKLYSSIYKHGNTSSSSIPICLSEIWTEIKQGQKIALTSFGGGFTYGAAILYGCEKL